jgi:F-type H+-transporting ATPase subunit b
MWKFGIPAAKSMMDARTERIRNDLDGADRARSEAETVLADYQRQLAEARTEATRIIEEARQQADQVRRDLTARAEAEGAELRQRNADQIAGERDRVLGELRTQVGVLAIELAGKVVESNLDQETNQRLIESYISSVGNGAR